MKRYCIFSAHYLPHIGGVERYTGYIAKKLVEGGDMVAVVTSRLKGQKVYEVKNGVLIYRLPCFSFMDGRLPILKPGAGLKEIKKCLERERFDLVIVNTRFYAHSLYGMRFAKRNGIKCITIEHGTGYLTFHNKFLDLLEHAYEHAITFFDKLYCKDYYGVSRACCTWSRHFGIKPKGVLYNAVDIEEIERLMEDSVADYRAEYGIGDGDVVISYTGRMLREKGIPQLLEAFGCLRSEKRLLLFLAGEGPLDSYVSDKARQDNGISGKNKIIPLGGVDFPHIAALLKITDIFCLPSDSEGFPTSVLEAAAARCFIVTTANGGAKELVKGSGYGMIMPDNEVRTLVDSLNLALADGDWRYRAANKTYAALKKKFTFDATVKKIRCIAGEEAI